MVPVPDLVKSMDRHGIDRVALIARLSPPLELGSMAYKISMSVFKRVIHHEQSPLIGLIRKGYAASVNPTGRVSIMGKKYPIFPQPDNDLTVETCAERPDRFYGWAVVNPRGGADPVGEIERCLRIACMIGVKAHPYWHHYPVSRLTDAAALCESLKKPMLIHLGLGENGDFRLLPEKFPGLKVIYAHAGIPYPNSVCAYARERKNVYVDLSSSAFMNTRAADQALRRAGPDKCLFGSDGPYGHVRDRGFDFGFYQKMLMPLSLSGPELEKVMGGNLLRIIGG